MAEAYRIDAGSGLPVYRQLVDALRSSIKLGALPSGQQLPTVQQQARDLGLSAGTVKRAYDELERLGFVEKVQGRGTFVSYRRPSDADRRERALAAVDTALDTLGELGYSGADARRFLEQKLQERESRESKVRVTVVECNGENLSRLADQLRAIERVEVSACLLDRVMAYLYNLGEETDLVVTTGEHVGYLQSILPEQKKIARIALRLSPGSMARIVKLEPYETVGIVSCSHRFGELLRSACLAYTEHVELDRVCELSDTETLQSYLRDKTAVLVPEEVEKYADATAMDLLRMFADTGKLIRCAYEMDEGSFLFLQEKIARLREKKLK